MGVKAKGSSYGVAGVESGHQNGGQGPSKTDQEAFRDQEWMVGVIRNQGGWGHRKGDSGNRKERGEEVGERGTGAQNGEEDHW